MKLLFLISVSYYVVVMVNCQCGDGEVFSSCGTSCPSTCDNYNDDRICTLQCVTGCFCAGDKVRDPDGKCVEKTECRPQCPENQKYECGTECPDTCDNYFKDRSCIESCRLGCFCKQGFVLRNETASECIHTSECPDRTGCRADEHYDRCGTACPETCGTQGQGIPCVQSCEAGCFCNDDYVLHNGTCVPDVNCDSLLGQQRGGVGAERSSVLVTLLSLMTVIYLF